MKSYKQTRRNVVEMLEALKEVEVDIEQLKYYAVSGDDRDTSLFEAVRDLFDDTFSFELECEEKRDQAEMYLDDLKFEREMK